MRSPKAGILPPSDTLTILPLGITDPDTIRKAFAQVSDIAGLPELTTAAHTQDSSTTDPLENVGLLVGMIDTPMTKNWNIPKSSATSVVTEAYNCIAAGALEILADDTTRDLKSRLNTKGEELYPWMHAQLRALMAS
ncbi:hypothetical protein OQ252_07600 [Acetobacter farinalis]|uniref:Uncharacterized protein n=1 Tax=Acetobacter farinalis TaxID=1260984 RepID=A0ABT3Q7K6_9PROT|nr:hypothetical protein [Acetobacter farinalis]MCX2561257.1 hypothetical protein [Acetobacter farinalis]NHO29972.1 hypothetical protein [Acetobacter farinalis]